MTHYRKHIRHAYNTGYVSDEIPGLAYVNIPKNASLMVADILKPYDFYQVEHVNEIQDIIYLVILRNPIKRWYSGINEYVKLNNLYPTTPKEYQYLVDGIVFDEHTEKQCSFLNDFEKNRCKFIHIDENFNFVLQNFLCEWSIDKKTPYSDSESRVRPIDTEFRETLKRYTDEERLGSFYQEDFEFINSVVHENSRLLQK